MLRITCLCARVMVKISIKHRGVAYTRTPINHGLNIHDRDYYLIYTSTWCLKIKLSYDYVKANEPYFVLSPAWINC